jgi:endonuclease-3
MNKATNALELIAQSYGMPQPSPISTVENPLLHLIEVIIAQNTSRVNRNKALTNLNRRFPDPALIAESNVVEIIDAIYVAGLANVKAPRLQALVTAALEATDGTADLSFLYDLPTDEALQFLSKLPGIGALSASLVLLFTMGRPVLPVNTGLHRVAQRVGMIPPKVGPERAQWLLQAMLPSEAYYPFHLNMVRHARETCHAARPACEACCLAPICNWVHGGTTS